MEAIENGGSLHGNAKVAVASYQKAKRPETTPFVEETNK